MTVEAAVQEGKVTDQQDPVTGVGRGQQRRRGTSGRIYPHACTCVAPVIDVGDVSIFWIALVFTSGVPLPFAIR